MTEKARTKCPACGKNTLERQLGTGGAIIFKGSGFYQTDYRSDSYKKAAKADSGASESKATEKATSDSKPATKTEALAAKSEPKTKPKKPASNKD
jgi:predicted nucleic acid-binding Zn ribbon protein